MIRKSKKTLSRIITIVTILSLLGTFLVGYLLLFLIGVSDPGGDVNIESFISQKDFEIKVVGLGTLAFMFALILSLNAWLGEKRFSDIIFSAVALLHFFIFIYYVNWYLSFISTAILFISSLDLVILVSIFLNRVIHKFSENN